MSSALYFLPSFPGSELRTLPSAHSVQPPGLFSFKVTIIFTKTDIFFFFFHQKASFCCIQALTLQVTCNFCGSKEMPPVLKQCSNTIKVLFCDFFFCLVAVERSPVFSNCKSDGTAG